MSTVIKICIPAPEKEVAEAIELYLIANRLQFVTTNSEWPLTFDRDIITSDDSDPSVLSLKEIISGVSEVHFNCISTVKELSSNLSKQLDSGLVVIHYNSTANASYWSYYLKGELLREIHAGEGTVYSQSGLALAFEDEEPGRDASEEWGEPHFTFDDDAMNIYNSGVSIPVEVYQELKEGWLNFEIDIPRQEEPSRPWWKFW